MPGRRSKFAAKLGVLRRYRAWRRAPSLALRYLLSSNELDNFTYDISNRAEVVRLVAAALGADGATIASYVAELDADTRLVDAISAALATRHDRNRTMPYGRRLGWYAAVRQHKPVTVVETGVHDGLGSAVLLRAIERNASEGHEGRLVAFDIRADVGWLVPTWLRDRYELRIGDSVTTLADALEGRPVDLFIHDSDHRYEYEWAELTAVLPVAAPRAVLVSDNAHATTALQDLCDREGLPFTFVPERPKGHFYPGAGIGITRLPGA